MIHMVLKDYPCGHSRPMRVSNAKEVEIGKLIQFCGVTYTMISHENSDLHIFLDRPLETAVPFGTELLFLDMEGWQHSSVGTLRSTMVMGDIHLPPGLELG